MMYCHFICKDIKLQTFSKFWDGDIDLISEMIFRFFSFAKKMNMKRVEEIAPMEWIF